MINIIESTHACIHGKLLVRNTTSTEPTPANPYINEPTIEYWLFIMLWQAGMKSDPEIFHPLVHIFHRSREVFDTCSMIYPLPSNIPHREDQQGMIQKRSKAGK